MWEQLINAREGKGLSQEALAKDRGLITASCVSNWEKKMPSALVAFLGICETLDASPNALLGYVADKESHPEEKPSTGATLSSRASQSDLSDEDLTFVFSVLKDRETSLRKTLSTGLIGHDAIDDINHCYTVCEKISRALGRGHL